jgi:hypothetical protein
VLLLDIRYEGVEVLALPQFARCWNGTGCFQVGEGLGVGGVCIDRNHAGDHRVRGAKPSRKKRLAAPASRVSLSRNSSVFPLESTARYKYSQLPFTLT